MFHHCESNSVISVENIADAQAGLCFGIQLNQVFLQQGPLNAYKLMKPVSGSSPIV